jgi:hypothetical protein
MKANCPTWDLKGVRGEPTPLGFPNTGEGPGEIPRWQDPELTISATERLWHSRGTGTEYQGWIASN